jgi:peptidoglycan lytic transglycosylase G
MDAPTPSRAAPPGGEPRRRVSLVAALVAFGLIAAALLWGASRYTACKEPPHADGQVSFSVSEGSTGEDVVRALAERGLIRCGGFVGNLLLRGTGKASTIRAGTYDLTIGMSLDQIVDVLTRKPDPVATVRLTVPEGLRIRSTYAGERSIASVVHEQLGISAERVADLAESGDLTLLPYLPKSADTAEGFLFPETYRFVKKGLTAQDVVDRLLAQFDTEAANLPWGNTRRLHVTPYEAVIVASMVEREAAVAKDRPIIAGVIYRRLAEGMTLGIDATLLYDDPTPDGRLSSADLQTDTPYNTRINAGLPPTPIASPGRASIQAALDPAATDYLYYVLCPPDGPGVHRFAETYEEHLRNVRECLG